jgi:LysR family transcriptional regulator, hydrogen peroxide-inducible genes activator
MDMPTLRQLEYFVAIADQGSFSRAADSCDISQPGLSSQIRSLEDRLKVPLFERRPKQILLTNAGQRLLPRARRLLIDAQDLSHAASEEIGGIIGRVNVGAIPTMAPYLLPTLTAAVRQQHPRSELVLHEERTDELIEQVLSGDLDLGLLAMPVTGTGLVARELVSDPFVLAFSADSPPPTHLPVELPDLDGLPMVLLEEGH